MNPSERTEQREVHYSGRVQGVGFRVTTRSVAQRFDVTGYVQNLPDGRVKMVAEGTPAELDRFMSEIKRVMAENIDGVRIRTSLAGGEFELFDVRH